MLSKIYRVIPLGKTGCGKSQLCNFIYQDKDNTKFKVSGGFDSETKEPQCEIFTRKIDDELIQLELIDTAGCGDSEGDDEENFKKLLNKLKEKKSVDLFLLTFNFTEYRISRETRDYIKLLANTFTPTEFYNHLAIVFTCYPENPTDDDKKRKKEKTGKIIELIKKEIGLANGQAAIPPNIYELDTKKYNGNFIPKFQATIDIILIKMQDTISLIGPVNTENIRYCGVEDRLKEEQKKLEQKKLEFERLKKMEEEKKRIYEELMKRREEKIKADNKKNEIEKKRLEQKWQDLQRETCRQQAYFSSLEAEHNKRINKLNDLLSRFDLNITKVDNLIAEKEKLICVEKGKIIDGILDIGVGIIETITIIGIFRGIDDINKGYDKYCIAQHKINQYQIEKNEYKEQKKKYEEEKKKLEGEKAKIDKKEEFD